MLMRAIWAVTWRDLRLGLRRPQEVINPLIFFLLVVSLFPLGVGPSPEILRTIAPGIIWVAALLATLMVMDKLFRQDYEDGSLEQLLLSGTPITLLVLGKLLSHWLLTGLPLVIISPLLGILMNLPLTACAILPVILLMGTPVLSLIGAIGVALTVGVRRGSVLLTLIIMPLYIPILIFGSGAVNAAINQADQLSGFFALFAAMNIAALVLCPLATAAALKITLD